MFWIVLEIECFPNRKEAWSSMHATLGMMLTRLINQHSHIAMEVQEAIPGWLFGT